MAIAIFPILLLALLITVVLAGVVLIVTGFRGGAAWSSPYCVACRYDLRGRVPEETQQCPECGADLSNPKAVGFIRHARRPRLIWLGVVVLISPVLLSAVLIGVAWLFARSGPMNMQNLPQQPTPTVLNYVKNNPDQPPGWDELANRIRAGSLTAPEAEQAIQTLISHMKATKPNGWDQPMHWQDDFLKAGAQAGLFSDQAMIDFADAFYGTQPQIDRLPRMTPEQKELRLEVAFGSNWRLSQHGGLPVEMLWAIDTVTIDGEPAAVKSEHGSRERKYVMLNMPELPPGDHELVVTLDAAYIDSQFLVGFNANNASPADWPKALKRWSPTAKDTLTVLGVNDQPVALSTDPTLDPGPGGVTIKHLVVQPESGRKRVTLEMEVKDGYIGALSYDVSLDLGGDRRDLGRMYLISESNRRSYSGMEHSFVLDTLNASVTTADVTLTPNPRHVYSRSEIDKVWGEPITFDDAPIQRFDLDNESSD